MIPDRTNEYTNISQASVASFIQHCDNLDVPDNHIVTQLLLFCQGYRDGRLGDDCIILLDGVVEAGKHDRLQRFREKEGKRQ